MKKQKGMRAAAFVLSFCLVFHSGTIYAAEGAAATAPEAIAETQADTTTFGQDDGTSDTSAGTDAQGQTQSDTSAGTDAQGQTQSDTSAATETQNQTQPDTPAISETQGQTQSDIPAGKETQGQTTESDPTTADTNAETPAAADSDSSQPGMPAAGETLPEGTTGSDENVSGTQGTETDKTATGGTTGETAENGETAPEQEPATGETAPMTEPLSENGEAESETESESDGIAMMMGLNEIAPIALDDGSVAEVQGGDSYDSISEAIEHVPDDGTIILLESHIESITVTDKKFTLDLNSQTLSSDSGHVLSVTGGTVTVKNGIISGTTSAESAVVLNSCDFTGNQIAVQNGINNNSSGYGGGISANGGSLTLIECTIKDSQASCGGGLYTKDTTVALTNCEFCGNNASGGMSPMGGGLYIEAGTITASGLRVHDNTASDGNGAGIYTKTLEGTISNSAFYKNTARNGGGIYTRAITSEIVTLNEVDIYENTLSSSTGSGAGLYISSKLNFDTGKICNNNCSGGNSALEVSNAKALSGLATLKNVEITNNENVKYTVNVGNLAFVTFDGCDITGNTATEVGGMRFGNDVTPTVNFVNTTIKENAATGENQYASGGLSFGQLAKPTLTFETSAVYKNTTASSNQADDICVGQRTAFIIPKASTMSDHGTVLENYVWLDKATGEKSEEEIVAVTSNTSNVYGYKAAEDIKRNVSKIGDTIYQTLQDAVDSADPDEEITLIVGESDEMGDTYTCEKVEITKSVKINFNGKNLIGENNTVFHVTAGGSLTLTGAGNIKGNVDSEGVVTLQGNVVADNYIHNGTSFTVDGKVDTINVVLGADKYITATPNFDANIINVNLDSEFIASFNNEQDKDTPDRIIIENAGTFDTNKISLKGLKKYLVRLVNEKKSLARLANTNEENDIVLKKILLEGVYVDGTKGLDEATGLTSDAPVQTIDKAIEILTHSELDTIWVVGAVNINEDTVIEIPGNFIKRHPTNNECMFTVNSATLELKHVTIDGMSEYFKSNTRSMIQNSGTLKIHEGAVLQNNDCSKYGDYPRNYGGAVYSNGTLIMDGGTIQNCKAFNGGGIYAETGTFNMQGGKITNCSVSGELGESISAGGGICMDRDSQLIFDGGTVTECHSDGMGGGIALGGNKFSEHVLDNETMKMNGGKITDCTAKSNGGGLYIQCSFKATIYSGTISGNHNNAGNFGGGGIYVNGGRQKEGYENGRLQLYKVAIRNNTSKDYGGGIAGCSTSNTRIYLKSGGVIYGNNDAEDDIFLSDNDGASLMPTSAPENYISDYMLGGVPYKWKRVEDGTDYGTNYLHEKYVKHLYTEAEKDSPEAVEKALRQIDTYIQNNSSGTRGGGIGSNGDVIIGSDFDEDEAIDISVTKAWDDTTYGPLRPEKVDIWLTRDGDDNTVSCVEIYPEKGEWPTTTFTNQPKYAPDGHKYEYGISEDITYLGNIYTPVIEQNEENEYDWTVTNVINCGRLKITKEVTKETEASGHKFEFTITLTDNDENPVSGTFPINDRKESITFKNGVGTVELANGEKVIINDIPENTNFEVLETKVNGYITYSALDNTPTEETRTVTGTIVVQQTSTANFKNECSMNNKVTITKHTVDTEGHEYPITQNFKIALFDDEELTNRVSEVKTLSFENGTSNTVTFDGLYYGKTYYVAELDFNDNPINVGTNYLSDGSSFIVQFTDTNEFEATNRRDITIEFKNVITENVVTSYLDLDMKKILNGRTPKEEDVYEFYIEALEDAPMPETVRFEIKPNEIKGFDDTFGEIEFTEAGTYSYLIKETKGSLNGVTYATDYYKIEITVTEYKAIDRTVLISDLTNVQHYNGKTFEAFKEMELPLTNVYHPAPITFAPQVKKAITGDVPADNPKDFTFRIVPDSSYVGLTMPTPATVTVTGQNTESFGEITFAEAGTYKFRVSEVAGTDAGYTYSDEWWTLTVTATDNLDGNLVITDAHYSWEDTARQSTEYAEFTNCYAVTPVDFKLEVTKEITGEEAPTDQTFEFNLELKGEASCEGVTLGNKTASVTGAGTATIDGITFTKAGTYTFQVHEDPKSIPGYSFDGSNFDVEVVVTDRESQLTVSSVTYKKNGDAEDGITFTNTYNTTSVSYAPQIRKVITGAAPQAGQKFDFTLTAKQTDGLVMPESTTATVSGQGTAMFDAVTFTKPGVYSFEIKEVNSGLPGYVYSDVTWTLNVQVTDEDSVLTVQDVRYQAGDESSSEAATFENRHLTGSLIVTKSLTYAGHPLHALKQTFYVALYADKECGQRVSDVKALVYDDTVSAEVIFDGLEIGVPYYIGECDKEGTVLDSGALLDGTLFKTVFANGNEVILSEDKEQLRRDFTNEFTHIPSDYYYQGELEVTKHLQDEEGNPKNSNDIFYLGVFEDEAHTKLSDSVEPNILTLDMAGHSSATAMVYTRTPDEAGLKLYIAEVDANGAVIQDKEDFGYDLTMSSDAPMLTMDQSRVSVSVTNREKAEEPETTEKTESETEKYTETEGQTDTEPPQAPESAKAVRTGDETALWLYLILLALSAGMIVAVSVKVYRKEKKD